MDAAYNAWVDCADAKMQSLGRSLATAGDIADAALYSCSSEESRLESATLNFQLVLGGSASGADTATEKTMAFGRNRLRGLLIETIIKSRQRSANSR